MAGPLYGCCIPLAGEGRARDCARRRVSERNRHKAALSAEITQEGEAGEAPPGEISATERKGVRGKPKKGYTIGSSQSADTLYPLIGSLPRNRLALSATGGASPVSLRH